MSERDGICSSQSKVSKYLSLRKLGSNKYVWYVCNIYMQLFARIVFYLCHAFMLHKVLHLLPPYFLMRTLCHSYSRVLYLAGCCYRYVEGMARTVTSYIPRLISESGNDRGYLKMEPAYYQIHFNDNERNSCVGCPVLVVMKPDGDTGYVDNPKIDISQIEDNNDLVPYNVVDLPNILDSDNGMVSYNDGYEFNSSSYFSKYNKPNDEFWLNAVVNPNQCSNHPLVAAAGDTPSKLNNKINSYVNSGRHVAIAFPPLFGRTRNSVTNKVEFLLFDPHLLRHENTVENPIPDGGGRAYYESNAKTWCANPRRTFLNEDHCEFANICSSTYAPYIISIDRALSFAIFSSIILF